MLTAIIKAYTGWAAAAIFAAWTARNLMTGGNEKVGDRTKYGLDAWVNPESLSQYRDQVFEVNDSVLRNIGTLGQYKDALYDAETASLSKIRKI